MYVTMQLTDAMLQIHFATSALIFQKPLDFTNLLSLLNPFVE